VAQASTAAASTCPAPSFDVVFEGHELCEGRAGAVRQRRTAALAHFRQRLGEALADAGLKPARAFTPHMTVAYARRKLESTRSKRRSGGAPARSC
jgi:2'-5' RNA ligase